MHIWICLLLCKLFSHSSKFKFQQLKFQHQENKKTKGKGLSQIYIPMKVSNLLMRRLNMLVS